MIPLYVGGDDNKERQRKTNPGNIDVTQTSYMHWVMRT